MVEGLRLLHYAVLLGLFGLTAFRAVGLRQLAGPPGVERIRAILVAGAVTAPILSAALMLASVAAMMGQAALAVEWATVEAVVTTTDLGWAFMARLALLVVGLAAVIGRGRLPGGLAIAALCYGLALMTLAWSGHAAASEGVRGLLHRLNDGVHLLAAGLWIGAIGWFALLTVAAHRHCDRFAPGPVLDAVHRFAPLGAALVAIVAVTGLINAQLIFGLDNSSAVLATDYGWLLAAKIGMVAGMLVCGAVNATASRRAVRAPGGSSVPPGAVLKALRVSLIAEFVLAMAILGVVAVLGALSPGG